MKKHLLSKLNFCRNLFDSLKMNKYQANSSKNSTQFLLAILLIYLAELSLTTIFNAQALGNNGRDFLWHKVQECVANEQGKPPKPDPCKYVNLVNKYVVANGKNPVEYLLLPTDKIPGIEDPNISQLGSVAYWEYAWEKAREYIPLKKSQVQYRGQFGLAINSKQARHQDQLHIHMSCIDKNVSMEIEKNDGTIPRGKFQNFSLKLLNNEYNVMRLDNESLRNNNNPFYLVKKSLHSSQNMADQSIAVVGRKQGGFYILKTESDSSKGYNAAAEKLLDESCMTQ